jgi:hypothetical protein
MTVRPMATSQVLRAYNVNLYSFKTENDGYGGHTERALSLMVTDSSHVRVFGHGGNITKITQGWPKLQDLAQHFD